jgi:hypothetical protein
VQDSAAVSFTPRSLRRAPTRAASVVSGSDTWHHPSSRFAAASTSSV